MAVPYKAKTMLIIWIRNSTGRYLPKRIENICLLKDIYVNVHSDIIQTETQMCVTWWISKHTVIYPCFGALLSNKRAWITNRLITWMNFKSMLKTKSNTKDYTCMILFIQNFKKGKTVVIDQRVRLERGIQVQRA